MHVQTANKNNQTSFNGYLKFNNRTIDANDIAEFATKTCRKELTPKECPGDEFTWSAVGSEIYNYRYYNKRKQKLDWLQIRMKVGNNPSAVSMIGSQHDVSFHNGLVDSIKGKIKLKNGKKYHFEFQNIVTPPTLSKLSVYSGRINRYSYPKAPVPKNVLNIDKLIKKAKKEDRIFRINAELNGNFFNFLK